MIVPTPDHLRLDAKGRPYFLWDCDVTEEEFRGYVRAEDPEERAYWVAKVMRQGRPDDVFLYVTLADVRALWARLEPILGRERAFWTWILQRWETAGVG